jgi:hypothetical protein
MFSEAGNDLGTCDARLESQWCALNRGRGPLRRDVAEYFCNIHGVLRAFVGTPIWFVYLFLHHTALEGSVREGVNGIEIHVVIAEELLEFFPLGFVVDERFGR